MSDPQNLNNSSPGSFVSPTQSVENALVPAQTNPPQAAQQSSSIAQPTAQTPMGQTTAGGSTQATALVLGDGLNVPIITPTVPGLQPATAGGGGGIIGNLHSVYAVGTSQADNTMNLVNYGVFIYDNAVPIGVPLLKVANDVSTIVYFSVTPIANTIATVAPLTCVSPYTTVAIGNNIQGADANSSNWTKLVPAASAAEAWYEWAGQFTAQARKDQVYRQGINIGSGGVRAVGGAEVGALALEMESYFEGSNHQMEMHLAYVDPTDTVHRVWSMLNSLTAPYGATLFIAAETLLVQASGGGPFLSIGGGAGGNARLASPSNTNFFYVDDSSSIANTTNGLAIKSPLNVGIAQFISNAVLKVDVQSDGRFLFQATDSGIGNAGGTVEVLFPADGVSVAVFGGDFRPYSNFGGFLGTITPAVKRWSGAHVYSYYGVMQSGSGSGAITFDPTSGEIIKLLASGNVTSMTITAALTAAQVVTLVLVQNAAGTATWPTTITNARLAGGAFTKTLTANAVDTLTFRYNTTDASWDQIGTAAALA